MAQVANLTVLVPLVILSGCSHTVPRPPMVPNQPTFGFCGEEPTYQVIQIAAWGDDPPGRIGKFITNSQRMQNALIHLLRDSQLGVFTKKMRGNPNVTYFIWDTDKLQRNGGGVVTHCNEERFDVWINIEHHKSQEGQPCTNATDSGNLRSLLAHELGHVWAWQFHGYDSNCDNAAIGNTTAVAWESTQLTGNFRRTAHVPKGCPCGTHVY